MNLKFIYHIFCFDFAFVYIEKLWHINYCLQLAIFSGKYPEKILIITEQLTYSIPVDVLDFVVILFQRKLMKVLISSQKRIAYS